MHNLIDDYYFYYCTHVLLNFISIDRVDQYEKTLSNLSSLTEKDSKLFHIRLKFVMQREAELYGITTDRNAIINTAKFAINAKNGQSILIPKNEIIKLFSNYGATWPLFEKLPYYANIGVTYGYREYDDSKKVNIQIFQPEAIIFEDIAILYNLIIDDDPDKKLPWKTNNALYRNITVACFNLLECFINGKASEFLHKNKRALSEEEVGLLTEKRANGTQRNIGLRDKYIKYPRIILNKSHHLLDETNSIYFKYVFGDMKTRRDSYVHLSYTENSKQISLYTTDEGNFLEDIKNTTKLIQEIETILHGNCEKLWYLTEIESNKKIDKEFFK